MKTRAPGRKGSSLSLLLLVCSVVVAILASTGSARPAARRGLPLTEVTVALLPLEPTALAFYAKERGFFRREGIDAKLTYVLEPAQIVAALLSGDAQFSSFNTGGLAVLKSRGAPIKVIAAGALYRRKAPTTALVAARGKRITRARDLVGKLIALDAKNNLAHVGLLRWLKRNGVSEDEVRFTLIPFAQMLGPLRNGNVDAAVLPEPYLTQATQRGARRVAYIFNAVCSKNCLLTFYVARKGVDTTLAARFRNAIQAAAVWANKKQNRRASGDLLATFTGVDRALIRKVTRTQFLERLRPALAQQWIDAFAEFGVIPASFPAGDLVK
jgi:NitT/TauT family transport system substrate-binding protein